MRSHAGSGTEKPKQGFTASDLTSVVHCSGIITLPVTKKTASVVSVAPVIVCGRIRTQAAPAMAKG